MQTIKLTAKRQATFPASVCKELGIKPGDTIELAPSMRKGKKVWTLAPVKTKKREYFGVLEKYIKKRGTPWTREHDGDATGAAWANSETV